MHRLFQYGAHCLSGRERLAARTGRSGGDYRAERRSLASIAFAEHLSHPHTNTGNNATYSSFCTGGWLSAVSVLGTSAIRENLKKQKKCTAYFSTVHVACQSENALQREPGVRMAITEQNAEALQGSLLQNTDTIPTQIQETTLPVPVFDQRMAVCCICSGSCCNPAKFEKQKKCTACFSTVHVACQSENALQREPGVRLAITEQNAEALQGSLLQNTDTIPTQIQETTLPVSVFATENSCLLYLFWELLQSSEI